MATPQQPIDSGFGARSTAAEVLEGIDLSGRLAIVTGGYSGLGLETVRALSGAGADVIVPARRREHATEVLAGIERVEVFALDLGDLDSVLACATQVLDTGRSVDILINNAAKAIERRALSGRLAGFTPESCNCLNDSIMKPFEIVGCHRTN